MSEKTASQREEAESDPMAAEAQTTLHAWNFRGFKRVEIPLDGTIFLVGDNSSGKSSILHLISCILRHDLEGVPFLDDDLAVGRYDYFSPYQNNRDVTFAFDKVKDGKRLGKMTTVKRVPNEVPKVMRCSYFVDGNVITLKRRGLSLVGRISKIDEASSFDELYELHFENKGFKEHKKSQSLELRPNDPMAAFTLYGHEHMDSLGVFDIITLNLPLARHIAPVRGLPERFYDFKRTLTSSGKHFAVMWRDLASEEAKLGFEHVASFGRESDLFQDIEVEPMSRKFDEAPLIVNVRKNGKLFYLNQVGVGISQVVPILVEAIFAKSQTSRSALLLQQPELHLHPIAQAALGTFFYKSLHREIPLIIESHSSYLIDRFRSEIRDEENYPKSNVSIFFCQNTDEGNYCHKINVDSEGRLIDAPDGYFSFFVEEMQRTFL
ncbi:AAA family ATPase [Sulfitobacter sp. MOLA879]|uniref:AAA family ATPase n=1 Tax=Sulfitobacter sp. MOLA879 TaxID=3368579 RepID=UPI0037477EFD